MPEGSPINVTIAGDWSRPATVLIEKISGAIGTAYKPYQIKRVAKAEAEAGEIMALSKIKITKLERRAVQRFIQEEARNQNNMENIITQSLPQVGKDAEPDKMEEDWIVNFFDKCRLISDKEMQELWSRILAGEASSPGKFSKRTINLLSSLDKQDAILFTKLCGFNWMIDGVTPLIYDYRAEIYKKNNINFDILNHLNAIGLITFEGISGYRKENVPDKLEVSYQKKHVVIKFPKPGNNNLEIGHVLLTSAGSQLANICVSEPAEDFFEYVIEYWKKRGLVVSTPIVNSASSLE